MVQSRARLSGVRGTKDGVQHVAHFRLTRPSNRHANPLGETALGSSAEGTVPRALNPFCDASPRPTRHPTRPKVPRMRLVVLRPGPHRRRWNVLTVKAAVVLVAVGAVWE